MKKYMVYFEDAENCYKAAIPAKSEKSARAFVEGNGTVITVKDITKDYPISIYAVEAALGNAHFGQIEIDLITRTLIDTQIAD